MNADLGMSEDLPEDWRARWQDRLQGSGEEPSRHRDEPPAREGEATDAPQPLEPSGPAAPEQPDVADLPRFGLAPPEAVEARRRVQSEVDRARAEMEELVRKAAAIEAEAAATAAAGAAQQTSPGPSSEADNLRRAVAAAEKVAAEVDAATERARLAASEADAATRRAQAIVERAETTIERAEQAAARATRVQLEADQAVARAEHRLGEMLDALLLDLRQIGDPL